MPTTGTLAPTSTLNQVIGADGYVLWHDDASVPATFRWLVLSIDLQWAKGSFAGLASHLTNLVKSGLTIEVGDGNQGVAAPVAVAFWGVSSITENLWPFLNPVTGQGWTRNDLFSLSFGIRHLSGPNITWTGTLFRRTWSAWQLPTITSLDVTSGLPAGGTAVLISGTEFYQNNATSVPPRQVTVTFGDVLATLVSHPNSSQIHVTTPAHAAGMVDVVVTCTYDDGSISTATLAHGFTYVGLTAVSPSSAAPGESIQIIGAGFIDGDEGSICAPGTSSVNADGTVLTCRLPAAGEATVGGPAFAPGPYSVVVDSLAPLVNGFTGEVMSTKSVPFLNPIKRFVDESGNPLAGGKVYTYASDSSTPQATYTDPALTVGTENENPIILDDDGQCVMWMLPMTYRIELQDANGVVQEGYPIDGVPGSIWPGAIGAQVTTTPAANANSLAHQFTATMNKASTGVHALFAANYFAAPTITAGGATLTEASTVYIAGPPTLGSSAYSLHVAAGISKFDGAVQVPGGFTGSMGFYGTAPIAQQVLATGAGHTVDDVIGKLQALGLVKQA